MQDYVGTVTKNYVFYLIHAPKIEINWTTEKFRIFYPKTKKIAPDFEFGCPSYGLSKSSSKIKTTNEEGSVEENKSLNLTVK